MHQHCGRRVPLKRCKSHDAVELSHEFIYKTWFEDPTPAYEAVRAYVNSGYDYNVEYDACMIRAKTPQLVFDEIDKLMEQLGLN